MFTRIWDGFQNVVANLGTARDKASASTYAVSLLDYHQLLTAYRSSWLPQAIVDIPALDSVRKWRAWQAEADQITLLEAEEKRLNLRERVQEGMTAARLFGGAALYIGTGDTNPAEPLRAERIGGGRLRSLTVMTPLQLAPEAMSRDIEGGFYGRPEFYNLAGERGQVRIHASRLVIFCGAPVPDAAMTTTGWADSVLLAAMDAVKQADGTSANIASLIFEAKVDVFRFKGLADKLAENDPRTDDMLARRLGQVVYLGFQAAYARRLNHGFVGEDELGRSYNQAGYHFVEGVAQQWQRIVAEEAARLQGQVAGAFARP